MALNTQHFQSRIITANVPLLIYYTMTKEEWLAKAKSGDKDLAGADLSVALLKFYSMK